MPEKELDWRWASQWWNARTPSLPHLLLCHKFVGEMILQQAEKMDEAISLLVNEFLFKWRTFYGIPTERWKAKTKDERGNVCHEAQSNMINWYLDWHYWMRCETGDSKREWAGMGEPSYTIKYGMGYELSFVDDSRARKRLARGHGRNKGCFHHHSICPQ